jgi:hypothetical protein
MTGRATRQRVITLWGNQQPQKKNTGLRIGSPGDFYTSSLLKMWHSFFAEYTIEDSYTPTHCDIISDIIHDGSNLFCH